MTPDKIRKAVTRRRENAQYRPLDVRSRKRFTTCNSMSGAEDARACQFLLHYTRCRESNARRRATRVTPPDTEWNITTAEMVIKEAELDLS